jgi:hypothetical protein
MLCRLDERDKGREAATLRDCFAFNCDFSLVFGGVFFSASKLEIFPPFLVMLKGLLKGLH